MTFDRFFDRATGGNTPFPFQVRFSTGPSLPSLVKVPTGLGKTAMAVLGWLWRRQHGEGAVKTSTPRRLVYCLPMRVLVEQTRDAVRGWLENLGLAEQLQVYVLMGGEQADDWDLYPEKDAVLIGTQDMLLSRALNRGYGMSRYRWPMDFGLLNNDCLWVFDEVQLMDVGAATSAQMEALRRKLGVLQSSHSVWMSATLDEAWLDTVDFQRQWLGDPLELREDDKEIRAVNERYEAAKPIERSEASINEAKACAAAIIEKHQEGSLTLAVFNTVRRAIEVARAVERETGSKPVLIHSRFRAPDRKEKLRRLRSESADKGRIVISTQVVEAGVDVSAKVLFTEIAPWASLVQRFGRCNRKGEFNSAKDAQVCWFGLPKEEKDREKLAKPYDLDDVVKAEALLNQCVDVGPASLAEIDAEMRLVQYHVIRKRDLVDLFDTTPDLAGNDIDISCFIRSGDERDVQVFWRAVPKDKQPDPEQDSGKAPDRDELCAAPFYEVREFVKEHMQDVWCWNGLERLWANAQPDEVYPGQTYLVRSDAGGYQRELGWDPKSKAVVQPVDVSRKEKPESYGGDPLSETTWQTVAGHTDDVVNELAKLLSDLPLDDDKRRLLNQAARWHDRGKAHEVFQAAVSDSGDSVENNRRPMRPTPWQGRRDIGKAPQKPNNFWGRYCRPHFRHELASALAMLQAGVDAMAAYLVAAHHGKVRLSIRSLPNERTPDDPVKLFARGIWDGDMLPAVKLGGDETAPEVRLSLECMKLGRSASGDPSWAERMLRVRDSLGPFGLAYLEALLRAADMRASANPSSASEEATS